VAKPRNQGVILRDVVGAFADLCPNAYKGREGQGVINTPLPSNTGGYEADRVPDPHRSRVGVARSVEAKHKFLGLRKHTNSVHYKDRLAKPCPLLFRNLLFGPLCGIIASLSKLSGVRGVQGGKGLNIRKPRNCLPRLAKWSKMWYTVLTAQVFNIPIAGEDIEPWASVSWLPFK
jgi:hypothetical protein